MQTRCIGRLPKRWICLTPKLSCKRSAQCAAHQLACDSISIGENRNASADLALVSCSDTLDSLAEILGLGILGETGNLRMWRPAIRWIVSPQQEHEAVDNIEIHSDRPDFRDHEICR
jgi:hypothetical protein